ncbi:MAG: hypothetical protein JKY41_13635 [Rhodobacteraceae bacterium]|nr:hypothetical protein [Paracoccaceae bacterium]
MKKLLMTVALALLPMAGLDARQKTANAQPISNGTVRRKTKTEVGLYTIRNVG